MCANGFAKYEIDHCCYFKIISDGYIILLLYVDDILVAGSNMNEINILEQQLSKEFRMNNLGAPNQIVGKRSTRDRSKRTLNLPQ